MTFIDSTSLDPHWEHFSHEADMGIRGYGSTPAEAYQQAAQALTAVITNPKLVRPVQLVEVLCEGNDLELLLVDWLNAIVYEMATRQMLFSRFEVSLDGLHLKGKLWGEPVFVTKHQPAVEVKGATFTSLRVEQKQGRWVAQCVVDV